MSTPTTKHNHGSNYGRKVAGCPRCDELKAGAQPVSWNGNRRREEDERRAREIRSHDCVASRCAVICTFGDW